MSTNKQALTECENEWLKKLADMEYCKSNPGHWLMSLKDTNNLAHLALRSVSLLDELEAAEKYAKERDAENEDLMLTVGRLRVEREAAKARIAELEAREVKLPKPISVLHRRNFIDAHRSIYAYPEAEVNAALAAAGISVKGE